MRLFYALKLPRKGMDYAEKMIRQLQPFLRSGAPTPAERLHLTLLFLGETDAAYLLSLKELLKDHSVCGEPMSFQSVVSFQRGSLIAAALKVAPKIVELQKKIADTVRDLGLNADFKPFRPHVTLIRNASYELPFSELKKNILVFNKPFPAEGVGLFCSERIGGTLVYREL